MQVTSDFQDEKSGDKRNLKGARALEFKEIGVRFGEYTAVKDVSIVVNDGEFVSVIGPTGCGKSTLLNVAAGLLDATQGEITVFGERLVGLNSAAGYLFQMDALMPWRTALGNVIAGLEFRKVDKETARSLGKEWLTRVGLSGRGHLYPHELSGGMRKRVALAQTLVMNPKIILMDEPFSALDVQTRVLMENELLELWTADRKSVLFITHDLDEAISLSDKVIILSAGPETHPIAEFSIDLPRPRDVYEIRTTPEYVQLHTQIWDAMRDEVLKAYGRNQRALGE